MNKLVLHTGMTKTASSTLQNAVLSQHSGIHYLGKIIKNGVAKGCVNTGMFYTLRPVLWDHKEDFDPEATSARLRREIEAAGAQDKVVVGSWEALGGISPARYGQVLSRANSLGFELKVMVAMRNPLTWLTSQYLQEMQGHFIRANRDKYFRKRPYLPFDGWLKEREKMGGGFEEIFNHANNIRVAVDLLGEERVSVVVFEELKVNAHAYYRQIAEAIGVDAEETLRLADGAFSNPRLTQAQVAAIRKADAFPWRRRKWRSMGEKERRRILRDAAERKHDKPAVQELTRTAIDLVSEATRRQNAWVEANLGLNLSGHGYPV